MSARSNATTTLKLDTCSYSEIRIYPGRGSTFVSRDGKTHIFANRKVESLFHQKIKPVKLTWTQAWRRANKKAVLNVGMGKKRTRGTTRTQKAIVGLSLDELQKKRAAAATQQGQRPPLASNKKH